MVCPFVATNATAAAAMVRLAGDVRPGQVVLDLGCGDGAVLVEAVRGMRGLAEGEEGREVVGVELDGVLANTARRR